MNIGPVRITWPRRKRDITPLFWHGRLIPLSHINKLPFMKELKLSVFLVF